MCLYSILVLLFATALSANGDTTEYTVSTREEFLNAIGPDRTIVIAEGEIIIVEIPPPTDYECALFPTEHPNQYVEWECESDGVSLVITAVENLTIRGSGELATSLLTEPRYSFVMEFHGCSGINIENLVFGHSPGGYCENGVLGFVGCTDITVDSCDLFGCGIVGLELKYTQDFTFSNSVIRDCTYGIMELIDSRNLVFENSVFRDNEDLYGVIMTRCTDVTFRDCLLERNTLRFYPALFEFTFCEEIMLQDCIIRYNTCEELFSDTEIVTLNDVELDDNQLTID